MIVRAVTLMSVGLAATVGAPDSGVARDYSALEIVQKVHGTFGQIEDYRVTISLHVDIEDYQIPDRAIGLLYKKPDKIRLIGADFATLPRETLIASPSQVLDEGRYEIRLAGSEIVRGRKAYVLHLLGREFMDEGEEDAAPDLVVWVDARRWVIVQMDAHSGEKKQGRVTIEHERVADKYWLPAKTEVEIYMENIPGMQSPKAAADSAAVSRRPEKGMIELTFHEYEVNSSLPDSLFKVE